MNEESTWDPQINAAIAFARDHFVVCYTEIVYDDPFTAIIEYSGAFPQPWSRTDVSRQISSVAPWVSNGDDSARFVALSDEGDVYFVGDGATEEKIIGAGLNSPDSTPGGVNGLGGGLILGLADVDNALYAVGQRQQVYRRAAPEPWARLAIGAATDPRFQPINFTKLAGLSARDVYLLGVAQLAIPDLDEATERALPKDDYGNAWLEAHKDIARKMGLEGIVNQGRLFHFDGAGWRALEIPNNEVAEDVYIEDAETVWLVTSVGSILRGNARTGFQAVPSIGGDLAFLSMTKLGFTYYLGSAYALHTFDGRTLSPLKPRVRRSPPTPFRVQAVDDVLFYFDYRQGVQRFDGQTWERIDIPPELLQRNFKGLKRPGP